MAEQARDEKGRFTSSEGIAVSHPESGKYAEKESRYERGARVRADYEHYRATTTHSEPMGEGAFTSAWGNAERERQEKFEAPRKAEFARLTQENAERMRKEAEARRAVEPQVKARPATSVKAQSPLKKWSSRRDRMGRGGERDSDYIKDVSKGWKGQPS